MTPATRLPARPERGKRLKNLALVAGSLTIVLLASELILRAFYTPPSKFIDTFSLSMSPYYQDDSELIRIPRPDVSGVHDRPGSFASTFSTNSIGLRDREHAFAKPEGVTRIVVLGDSFAWGFGVNDGEVFTDRLETMRPNLEVINLGVTAFGLIQEAQYFERLGRRFDPDVVLVAFVQNDVYERPQPILPAASGNGAPQGEVGAFLRLRRYAGSNVLLYRLVLDALDANRAFVELAVRLGLKSPLGTWEELDPNILPAFREYPAELESAWERTTEQLAMMNARASELGGRFIVAMVPTLQAVEKGQLRRSLTYSRHWLPEFDLDKPYDRLATFARAEGFELIDPVDRFREATAEGQRLYLPRDMHFSAAGHRLFAEEIAAYLQRGLTAQVP